MLNSTKHEVSTAHKNLNAETLRFLMLLNCQMLQQMFRIYSAYKCLHANKCWIFTLLINVNMPTNVGILIFMSRIKLNLYQFS